MLLKPVFTVWPQATAGKYQGQLKLQLPLVCQPPPVLYLQHIQVVCPRLVRLVQLLQHRQQQCFRVAAHQHILLEAPAAVQQRVQQQGGALTLRPCSATKHKSTAKQNCCQGLVQVESMLHKNSHSALAVQMIPYIRPAVRFMAVQPTST